jgi:hypothetical protein
LTADYPAVSQFRSDSPRCGATWNGCAVAATEAILRRYRPDVTLGSQRKLGQSMGLRHRRVDRRSHHGVCPVGWCTYCSYLELKARLVPVGYGKLTIEQVRAHAVRRHALHLAGWYGEIRAIGSDEYGSRTPAGGRSDTAVGDRFLHSIVIWAAGRVDDEGRPTTYIVGDPDFGSSTRPLPPYCEYDAEEVERFYRVGRLAATYCLLAPEAPDRRLAAAAGVTPRFGGVAAMPRLLEVVAAEGARQRRSPYVRAGNLIQVVPPGTQFRSAQTTLAGTNVAGSTMWRGDASGMVWMHDSVFRST